MRISQYEIWLVDLNPRIGTKSGKTRPVMIVQTDLLNHVPQPLDYHMSLNYQYSGRGKDSSCPNRSWNRKS